MKKITMPKINSGKDIALSMGLAALTFVFALFYGPLDIHNPFAVMMSFLMVQALLIILTGNYENKLDSKLKRAVTFGPLKLVTAVLITAFTMPVPSFLLLLVPGAVVCLIFAGISDLATAGRCVWDKYHDHKTFNNQMREIAQTARIEESLSSDLANFLTGADPAGKKER